MLYFKVHKDKADSPMSFVTNVEETCKKVRGALFSFTSKFFLSYETRLQFLKHLFYHTLTIVSLWPSIIQPNFDCHWLSCTLFVCAN
jgi:hypothetical protein